MTRPIHIEFVYPPIPVRTMDYCATFDGYEPGDPIGWGSTEDEARADLLDASDDHDDRADIRCQCPGEMPGLCPGPASCPMCEIPEDDDPQDNSGGYGLDDCGRTAGGTCMLAGTEHCDFDCPFRG